MKKLALIPTLLISISIQSQIPPPIELSRKTFINDKYRQDSTFKNLKHLQTNDFETLNSVRYKRLTREGRKLIDEYSATLEQLLDNNHKTSKDTSSLLEARLEIIQNNLKISGQIIDSLDHEYNKDLLLHRIGNFFNFNKSRSQAFFDLVYDNDDEISLLNNANFNSFKKSNAISTEILSGYLSVLRASLSVLTISNTEESESQQISDSKEAFQRFLSTGGNLTLGFEYPLIYLHSRNGQFNLVSMLNAKGNADFPQLGTNTNGFSGNIALGSWIYADAALSNNLMRFYVTYDASFNYSSTEYRNKLFIENPIYGFGQLTIGAIIKDTIKIAFTINTHSTESSLITNKIIFGGEVAK